MLDHSASLPEYQVTYQPLSCIPAMPFVPCSLFMYVSFIALYVREFLT